MFFTLPKVDLKKILNPRNIIIAVLFIALCFTQFRNCTINNSLRNTVDSLTLANQTLDSIKNVQGQTIYTQAALVTSQQEDIVAYTNRIFDLKKQNERLVKKVLAYQGETTVTKIDTVEVPFVDTVERQKFSDSVEAKCAEVINFYELNYIKVPRVAKDSTANYSIDISTTKTGNVINSLNIPDSNYFRIIEKKGGFFRKVQVRQEDGTVKKKLKFHVPKTIEFQSFHTNPLVHVTGQTSIYYTPAKKGRWLEKALFIGAGIFIGSKL